MSLVGTLCYRESLLRINLGEGPYLIFTSVVKTVCTHRTMDHCFTHVLLSGTATKNIRKLRKIKLLLLTLTTSPYVVQFYMW